MTLIEFPIKVLVEEYESTVQRMVEKLAAVSGVRCIYQIGHVSTPGISDLDLLVVFDSAAHYADDPRLALGSTARYLFAHNLFGVTQGDFAEARGLSFFHNYQVRWGVPEITPELPPLSAEEQVVLKRQVALEYMLRIYLSLFVELTYGIIKVRNLLLHAKALLYDCEFLDIGDGEFRAAASRIVGHRNMWFTSRATGRELARDADKLCQSLGETLAVLLKQHSFFLPGCYRQGGSLARHITLQPGLEFGVSHRGLTLPAAVAAVSRKYVNFLHRLNRFAVVLPYNSGLVPPVIQRAFDLRVRLNAANRQVCPQFMPLCTGFNLQ